MSTVKIPHFTLHNGVSIPQLGLGTWPMDDDQASQAVQTALDVGYRLIDTAEAYGNEKGVGEAIRRSKVAREDIFLTTKFNKNWHSRDGVKQACEASLKRLGLDYIDLLLIHWPNPAQGRYLDAFEGMLELVQEGKLRAAGVSNFKASHLNQLLERGLVPTVNQIQLDPNHRRDDLDRLHTQHNIRTESWSPLGRDNGLLARAAVTAIAQRLQRSPGQVVLRWHIQHGYLPVPKSSNEVRQHENACIFDFALHADDMRVLDGLAQTDPDMLDSDHFGH